MRSASAFEIPVSVCEGVGFGVLWQPATKITTSMSMKMRMMLKVADRRRRWALAANPASEKIGAYKLKRLAAVRVHPIVRWFFANHLLPFVLLPDLRDGSLGSTAWQPRPHQREPDARHLPW